MKGGGPLFQPLTDFARSSQGSTQNFFLKLHGDDPATNEVIVGDPTS